MTQYDMSFALIQINKAQQALKQDGMDDLSISEDYLLGNSYDRAMEFIIWVNAYLDEREQNKQKYQGDNIIYFQSDRVKKI